jgi:apolipoprotein N-acyltransferase
VAWAAERKAALPVLGLAMLWALLELLRERLFSGFPWVNLGSSQAVNPAILPLASITGQVGLHFAVALGNLVLFGLIFEQKLLLGAARSLSATAALGLLIWGAQAARLQTAQVPDGSRVKVGVIQGAIDQDQAWTQQYRERIMNTYLLLSQAALNEGAQVLVWPESAFPGFFNEDAAEARQLRAFAKQHKVHMLVGSTLSDGQGYHNAALWIAPDGNTLSQSKRHMVPFGEYVPFRQAVPVLDMAMARLGVSDFVPGEAGPLFDLAGLKTQPLICYESVFPAVPRQGPDPDLLGVITVDTWYGRSAGPVWHAAQCALRAVENGCWVARSAATGISLFADPQGHLLKTIALDQAGYAVMEIPRGKGSFYRLHGEWLAALFVLLLAILWGPIFFKKS